MINSSTKKVPNVFGGELVIFRASHEIIYARDRSMWLGKCIDGSVFRRFKSHKIVSHADSGTRRVLVPSGISFTKTLCTMTFDRYASYPKSKKNTIILVLTKCDSGIEPINACQDEIIGPDKDVRDIYFDESVGP